MKNLFFISFFFSLSLLALSLSASLFLLVNLSSKNEFPMRSTSKETRRKEIEIVHASPLSLWAGYPLKRRRGKKKKRDSRGGRRGGGRRR
jgi:hypothetical protein